MSDPKRHAIRIEFHADKNEDLLPCLELFGEALAERNCEFFKQYPPSPEALKFFEQDQTSYENPRMDSFGQIIGDVETIVARRKATCFDWAAAVAGYARSIGQDCRVKVVGLIGPYGRIGDMFHALVDGPSGVVDVCTLLRGYGDMLQPVLPEGTVGACCLHCAFDGTLMHYHSCAACAHGNCGTRF